MHQSPVESRRGSLWLSIAALAIVVLAVGLTVAIAINQRTSSSASAPGTGTLAPSAAPSAAPSTAAPTVSQTPTSAPTSAPTNVPTNAPTAAPSVNLSEAAVTGAGSGVNSGMVAGAVVGALAAVSIIGVLAVVWQRRRGQPAPRDGEQSVSLRDGDDSDSLELIRRKATDGRAPLPPPPPPPRRHRPSSVANEAEPQDTYVFPGDAEGAWADALLLQRQIGDAYSQPGGVQLQPHPGGRAHAMMDQLEQRRQANYMAKRMRRSRTRPGGASGTDIECASDVASNATRGTLWSARSRTSEPVGQQRQRALRILADEPPPPPVSRPRAPRSEAAGVAEDRRRMRRNGPRGLHRAARRARRAADDAQVDVLASLRDAYSAGAKGDEEEEAYSAGAKGDEEEEEEEDDDAQDRVPVEEAASV